MRSRNPLAVARAPSTAVALGTLCLRCLSTLPRNLADTVSRVLYRTEMRVPENLPVGHLPNSLLGLHLDDIADHKGAREVFEWALGGDREG